MIELGGNITLKGFEVLDPADLLITKKLVGSYVRKVCDEAGNCDSAKLTLRQNDKFSIAVDVTVYGKTTTASAAGKNVFMTIDHAWKATLEKLGITME
ncbi:hypothetical protein GF367_03780 [Candidatus Woesearchaeota archaeon]|nr:hypothetical protein [Candidatus Woesearchaeota archaeon]